MNSEDRKQEIDLLLKSIRKCHSEPGPRVIELIGLVNQLFKIGGYEAALGITEAWTGGDELRSHIGFVLYLWGDVGEKDRKSVV